MKKIFYLTGIGLVFSLLIVRCSYRPTTYLSLDPDNSYVGTEACQPCHKKITKSYLETGMGKSLYRPGLLDTIESFGPEVYVHDSREEFYYQPFWSDSLMYIKEFRLEEGDTVYSRIEKIDYVVGSGHQTRSYLIQRNGYLYEAPITWYVNKKIWDLSPGYDINNSRFDREIGLECMSCHTGYVDYVNGSKNRYKYISEGIDCEKCHGPGAEHIRLTEAGQLIDVGEEIDYSIVNPSKLPIQEQFDVCQQCHLQGVNVYKGERSIADFRPAMKLDEIMDIFVEVDPNQNAFGIASHAERLQQSRCFMQSDGKLNCTTCHDPHQSVLKTDSTLFISQCESCHRSGKEKLCSEDSETQLMMEGNCITCHMPSGGTSDIPHVSFHDHYIRVVKNDSAEVNTALIREYLRLKAGTSDPSEDAWGKAWLRYYEEQENESKYLDYAVEKLSDSSFYEKSRLEYSRGNYQKALDWIQKAILKNPDQPFYQFHLGEVQEAIGNHQLAYTTFLEIYQENQEAWDAGLKAGVNLLLAREGDFEILDQVETLFRDLYKEKPFDNRILSNLAFVYLNKRDFNQAESLLVQSLQLNPDHEKSLENMVYLQVIRRNPKQARFYLGRLKKKNPSYPALEKLEGLIQNLT